MLCLLGLGGMQFATPLTPRQRWLSTKDPASKPPNLAQDLPSHSYHASALYDGSSTRAAAQQYHSHDTLPTQQQHPHPQVIRTETNPLHTTVESVPDLNHHNGSNKLRLCIMWEATQINVWLDMAGPGEAFFKAFQKVVGKRKIIPDRTMMTIVMKNDESMPDELAAWVPLDEDSLDADWDTVQEWLNKNKRDKTPHIFGRVEIGEG